MNARLTFSTTALTILLSLSAQAHAAAKRGTTKKPACQALTTSEPQIACADDRARLADMLAGLNDIQYSWGAYKWNSSYMLTLRIPRDFDKDTKIGDLVDEDGNLLVFRVIKGSYRPDWKEEGSFAAKQGGYSYTLSPSIGPNYSASKMNDDPHVLIALQNVKRDKLFYPFARDFRSGKDPEPDVGRGRQLTTSPTGNKAAISWVDLTLDTTVEKLNGYAEIKVPIENENVIGIMPAKAFNQIMAPYKNKRFLSKDLFKKLLDSPELSRGND